MEPGKIVKKLIWAYFWLLIFEGALRKWIAPGLSSPLLLVRDPVALMIYLLAASEGRFPRTLFVPCIWVLGILCCLASSAGIGTFYVTLFGFHANFFHLPLIFVIPQYFDEGDVKRMGKWVLIILLPMAVLATLQFRSGTDGRLNVGVGGEIAGQLYAAEGKVRASGTFSFVNGLVSFLALSASFLLHHFLQKNVIPKWLAIAALPALILALGVSGSRSAVLAASIVVAAAGLVCLRRREKFGTAFLRVLLVFLLYFAMTLLGTFKEGLEVQRTRFESGGGLKTGIVDRYFGEFMDAFGMLEVAPILGQGMGMGTSAGASIMTNERTFLLGEGEWARVIMELGPILGMLYLALRIAMIVYAFRLSSRSLDCGAILPMLLLGESSMEMLTGQFGQATCLGFAALGMGLTIAAAKPAQESDSKPSPAEPPPKAALPRGRSRYAEALHRPPVA